MSPEVLIAQKPGKSTKSRFLLIEGNIGMIMAYSFGALRQIVVKQFGKSQPQKAQKPFSLNQSTSTAFEGGVS